MITRDQAPLCKFKYSVNKKNKVNNWSQEIHSITPYTNFEHIKGKENMFAESPSRLKYLGLYKDNDPEKPGYEYGKSIFKLM